MAFFSKTINRIASGIAYDLRRIFYGTPQRKAQPRGNTGPTKAAPGRTKASFSLPTVPVPQAEELDPTEEAIVRGEWMVLASSWQAAFRWVEANGWTWWNTLNGGHYLYTKAMPLPVVKAWFQSDSPGRYWWSHIRGVYSPAQVIQRGHGKGKPTVIRRPR